MSPDKRLEAITGITAGTMVEALGIQVTAFGDGTATGEMDYREDPAVGRYVPRWGDSSARRLDSDERGYDCILA